MTVNPIAHASSKQFGIAVEAPKTLTQKGILAGHVVSVNAQPASTIPPLQGTPSETAKSASLKSSKTTTALQKSSSAKTLIKLTALVVGAVFIWGASSSLRQAFFSQPKDDQQGNSSPSSPSTVTTAPSIAGGAGVEQPSGRVGPYVQNALPKDNQLEDSVNGTIVFQDPAKFISEMVPTQGGDESMNGLIIGPQSWEASQLGNKDLHNTAQEVAHDVPTRTLKQEDSHNLYSLGSRYFNGADIEKKQAVGIELLKSAAEMGHLYAQEYLARIYDKGLGPEGSLEGEADKFYRLAAESFDKSYPAMLADLKTLGDQSQLDYYSRVVSSLARCYDIGKGVDKDKTKARELYHIALEAANRSDTLVYLADLYERGEGDAKDEKEAARLYQLAANKGQPFAYLRLATMYRDGRGVEQDLAKSNELYAMAKSNFYASSGSLTYYMNIPVFWFEFNYL